MSYTDQELTALAQEATPDFVRSIARAMPNAITDAFDKLDADDKAAVEAALEGLKKALEGDDDAAIETATNSLNESSHKLAEALYAAAAQEAAEPPDAETTDGPEAGSADAEPGGDGENTVDADFTVVNECDEEGDSKN